MSASPDDLECERLDAKRRAAWDRAKQHWAELDAAIDRMEQATTEEERCQADADRKRAHELAYAAEMEGFDYGAQLVAMVRASPTAPHPGRHA